MSLLQLCSVTLVITPYITVKHNYCI